MANQPDTTTNAAEAAPIEMSVLYDSGGCYVEGYTDDDAASGYGDNPRVFRWYGSRAECDRIVAGGKAPAGVEWHQPVWEGRDDQAGIGSCMGGDQP